MYIYNNFMHIYAISKGKVMSMKAYLILEDGFTAAGEARGAFHPTTCEIVFNTSMTGYLEVLTDPSYAGQGIIMTYPLIGNYGVCPDDYESISPKASAFIVKELCDTPSNFRCAESFEETLIKNNIPCLAGVDTRSIVKRLRDHGTMRGMLTDDISDMEGCMKKIRAYKHNRLVESVSINEKKVFGSENSGPKIALMDFGYKRNIVRSLVSRNCTVTAYPCNVSADEIINSNADGVMLTNGPGDPQDCKGIISEIGKLFDYGIPIFAICLGHQLTALSQGADTERLKYGHRGANHPVKFLSEDRTYITSQNHGYVVVPDSLPKYAQVSHINVNDGTVEGIVYSGKPVFTVQFHPEASPGPHDTSFLFDRFIEMIGGAGK